MELPEDPVVVLLGDPVRIAGGAFDKSLKGAFEQSVYLAVVVVVVTYAEQALNVVPDGATESGRVYVRTTSHRVVG